MIGSLLRMAPPTVALEIDRGHVGAARLEWRGGQAVVAAHAREALPPDAVVPAIGALNMGDVGLVGQAVIRVLNQLGGRTSRVALVVPDTVAKVSLVRLEKVPARADDLHEIVRWQIRKASPFPVEQGVLSLAGGTSLPEGGHEFVATLARIDVIQQYEQACAMAGAHAGLVDLSTFSLINAALASGASSGDWLVVHVTDSYMSLALMRGDHLIFFRHRSSDAEGTLEDVIHQTAMYYLDRLEGAGFSRVLLAGGAVLSDGLAGVRRSLEERLGITPDMMDVQAPLVGILRREGRAA